MTWITLIWGGVRRTHELTDAFIDACDPGILWEKHGMRDDVVVCRGLLYYGIDLIPLISF